MNEIWAAAQKKMSLHSIESSDSHATRIKSNKGMTAINWDNIDVDRIPFYIFMFLVAKILPRPRRLDDVFAAGIVGNIIVITPAITAHEKTRSQRETPLLILLPRDLHILFIRKRSCRDLSHSSICQPTTTSTWITRNINKMNVWMGRRWAPCSTAVQQSGWYRNEWACGIHSWFMIYLV